MRRFVPFIIAALLVVLLPAAALAQEVEFEAELGGLGEAVGGLGGETAEDWAASAAEVDAALEALRGAAADLDYAEFDAAVAALGAAIEAGDIAGIEAAAEALAPAFAALEAAAQEGGDAGDGTEEPAVVDTGSGVNHGPNVGLLGVAGLLMLLAGGALALRRSVE